MLGPSLQRCKCQDFLFVFVDIIHIPRANASMFSIGPVLKRLWDNYSLSQWLKDFYCCDTSSGLPKCARKGECKLKTSPIQFCKIGLVLNGVHQFLPVVQGEAYVTAAFIYTLPKILPAGVKVYKAFAEHKRSSPLAKGVSWSHTAVDFHFWSSSVSQERSRCS